MTISVLLADDHSVLRDGLAALLGAQDGMTVVAHAQDGAPAACSFTYPPCSEIGTFVSSSQEWLGSFGTASRCKSKGAGARCWPRPQSDTKI